MAKAIVYPYLDMYNKDLSNISVEHWCDSWSIGMHRHQYYELFVIDHGSCRHIFNDTETLLIPGDAVLVPAHKEHGFAFRGQVSVYNCQFALETLDDKIVSLFREDGVLGEGDDVLPQDTIFWRELLTNREDCKENNFPKHEINSSKQRVMHLSPTEYTFVLSLLKRMLNAQQENDDLSALMKLKYLEMILIELKQTLRKQNKKYLVCSKANQQVIAKTLMYIEANLSTPLDMNAVAQQYAFSPNYFRKIFKDITGLSPVAYINRLRIIRACEYIQAENASIQEASEKVGIYDLNYFSRLFKKVMGCSPHKI